MTSQSSGVWIVIWDNVGRVEAALSKSIPHKMGSLEIEAKALEKGVSFAWDVGIQGDL